MLIPTSDFYRLLERFFLEQIDGVQGNFEAKFETTNQTRFLKLEKGKYISTPEDKMMMARVESDKKMYSKAADELKVQLGLMVASCKEIQRKLAEYPDLCDNSVDIHGIVNKKIDPRKR